MTLYVVAEAHWTAVVRACCTATLVSLTGYSYLRRSLLQLAGEIRLRGLFAPIEVVRDMSAVPRIYSQSWNGAYFFAFGFVHAQDRLWQIEMNRHIAAGRLADVLGGAELETDRFFRTLGIRRAAQASLNHFDRETRFALERYTAGVDAFLGTQRGPLPPEFVIFGIEPEPWEAADSVAWGR